MADSDRSGGEKLGGEKLGGEKLKDRLLKLRELLTDRVRIFGTGALSLVLVLAGLLFLVDWSPNTSATDAADVVKWIERLPTNPMLYLLIAALAALYVGWRWDSHTRLHKMLNLRETAQDGNSLTNRDWWVVRELRGRAFALRLRADMILTIVITLSLGGVYFLLLIIPEIAKRDQQLIVRERQKAVSQGRFQGRFSSTLQLISEGRYWFKVNEISLPYSPNWVLWDTSDNRPVLLQLPVPKNAQEVEYTILAFGAGEVLMTRNRGRTWSRPRDMSLKERERVNTAVFGVDGQHGMVGGDEGSVFVTQDGGQTWRTPEGVTLKEGETVWTATFGSDNLHGAVVGTRGSIFVTQDGGQTWHVPINLMSKETEGVRMAVFGPDSQHGVIGGDEGSVFVTQDGGRTWRTPEGVTLKEDQAEWIVTAVFGPDSQHGVIGGDEGSVFVTQDGGRTWIPTRMDYQDESPSFRHVVSTTSSGQNYMAIDTAGGIHILLKAYPGAAELNEKPLAEIRSYMEKADKTLRESVVGKEINEFLSTADSDSDISDPPADSDVDILDRLLGEFTAERAVTLTLLFFLVQLLVRLYQYSLRLASFWESRADAVLLTKSFAERKADRFDDLVGALAPDDYDFKPLPRPGHEALFGRLIRREGSRSPEQSTQT